MSKSTSCYPQLSASGTGTNVVSHAGTTLLLRTAEKTGLAAVLSTELSGFRKPLAHHGPGKTLLDLAVSLAIVGDCLADIDQLRAHPRSSVRWPPIRPSPA
ncbi:DDE family transposase [Rhodococcus sp. SMB37]|nr:DDE family transposase [Rhodococcus sp. SMB37]